MSRRFSKYIRFIILIALISVGFLAHAQKFSVESFRLLPNDVSAFINPVRDLNDEDCALLKIQSSPDFVFSTPLGIIKRIDNTGEIWLYIPAKSKKITIKHPEWGVLRDYAFPVRIDSHLTYEMRIDEPVKPNSIIIQEPIIETVRDTLVITHTDTLVLKPVKPKIPLSFSAVATIGFGGKSQTVTGGILLALMKRHGGFIHLSSDFGKTGKLDGECDRKGYINGSLPYYSPNTYHQCFMANAGAIHRLSSKFSVFEGLGYSSNTIAWQLAESEGGKKVKNTYYSQQGLSFEAGVLVKIKRVAVSASVVSIKGKEWFGTLGIGINIGKY